MTIEDCIDILTQDHNDEYVCHRQPLHVQVNAVFLINTVSVKLQDLPADDNGTYRSNGTRVWKYEVAGKPNGSVKKKLVTKGKLPSTERIPGKQYLEIKRTYRRNNSCEDFHQEVTFAEEPGNVVNNNLAVLQYIFVRGKERQFQITAHANKKDKSVPFLPVSRTTQKRIKATVKNQKPAKAMRDLSRCSTMMTAESSADVRRDLKQIYNVRASLKNRENQDRGIPVESAKDKLHSVMIMAVQEQGTDGEEEFIHRITAWPEPMGILGYQYQFHDISRFCSSQVGYHPLGIDTTFNPGEFYVTPTAYKSLILENSRDGNSPTSIGPTLVHMSRSYSAYCHLASKLLEDDSGIADLRGVVTDGEAGLMKAMKVFYPQTSQLRCSRHLKENCQDKLKSLRIKGNDQKYFMDAIFGTTIDGIFHEGLLDSQEGDMFDAL